MKHQGCILEFTGQRNRELFKTYLKVLGEVKHICIPDVFERVANSPCSRFWVSEGRAFVIIKGMLNGNDVLQSMRPNKREMFEEVYRRVVVMIEENPDLPLFDIVMLAVNSPAPKFYLEPRVAMQYAYYEKNRHFNKKKRKKH